MNWRNLLAGCSLAPTLALGVGTCPTGIGSTEGQKPLRVIRISTGPALLICGWSDLNAKQQKIYSEFELIDDASRNPIVRFGASDQVTIREHGSSVSLTEHHSYPVGKNWTYVPLPFRRYTITVAKSGGFQMESKLIFIPPKFSAAQLDWIQSKYNRAKEKGYVQGGLPSLIVLAALAGHSKFETLLPMAKSDLRLDGALGEEFAAAMSDFAEMRNRN